MTEVDRRIFPKQECLKKGTEDTIWKYHWGAIRGH